MIKSFLIPSVEDRIKELEKDELYYKNNNKIKISVIKTQRPSLGYRFRGENSKIYTIEKNDEVILNKKCGYTADGYLSWDDEYLYLFDSVYHNNLKNNKYALYNKDSEFKDGILKYNNYEYSLYDDLFICINSKIKVYYNIKTKKVGLIINKEKIEIDLNDNINKQINDILTGYKDLKQDINNRMINNMNSKTSSFESNNVLYDAYKILRNKLIINKLMYIINNIKKAYSLYLDSCEKINKIDIEIDNINNILSSALLDCKKLRK